ncbi:hypothetical protein GL218_03922 [Daldinia childiae]|uniref:uncharacterized protein n=1 Tax=Daldinia childiae TaxID=326645 RepID=UPI001444A1FA|nr:uncharacterized protein GL218_03922 [Daldinia childiae]KAF3061433.1 hypothetical protein GL218_03922 [Daldinia childiae]
MSRLSRGCLKCRQRRVKCDEGRPACRRCVNRNEACERYRDEASIISRHETKKVVEHVNAITILSATITPRSSRWRSRSTATGHIGANCLQHLAILLSSRWKKLLD